MGYTHYFNSNGPLNFSEACANKLRSLLDNDPDIRWEEDVDKPAEVSKTEEGYLHVRFNGTKGTGYETFCFTTNGEWDFCKTARKGYDKTVCKVLLTLKAYYGDDMEIGSDGYFGYLSKEPVKVGDEVTIGDGTWVEAMKEVNEELGTKFKAVCTKIRDGYGNELASPEYFDYTIEE